MRGDGCVDCIKSRDALLLKRKPEETFENDWDKMNKTTRGVIRSF